MHIPYNNFHVLSHGITPHGIWYPDFGIYIEFVLRDTGYRLILWFMVYGLWFMIRSLWVIYQRPKTWKLETGNWKLEIGNWKLEIGNWKLEIAISNFQFPILCSLYTVDQSIINHPSIIHHPYHQRSLKQKHKLSVVNTHNISNTPNFASFPGKFSASVYEEDEL
ncbi:hypothetical protein BZA77DRAFT_295784 [Pyronema omphalodes]|nr:hypothetical protein BZA77DRAFT_295784 [Pyronema omphalodes]